MVLGEFLLFLFLMSNSRNNKSKCCSERKKKCHTDYSYTICMYESRDSRASNEWIKQNHFFSLSLDFWYLKDTQRRMIDFDRIAITNTKTYSNLRRKKTGLSVEISFFLSVWRIHKNAYARTKRKQQQKKKKENNNTYDNFSCD